MIKKINTKKGISLLVLLITIAVILILLTTITFSADNIISNTKKRQFAKEMYEVQNLVDKYKYENDDYPYIIENDEKKVININVENIDEQFVGEDSINNTITLYPIDLSKAGVQNLSRGTKKDNNEKDVYTFSNKTGKVYYVKGFKVRNNTYYTLTDELKSLIGYGSNKNESNSKVIGEFEKTDYITDGLILHLDGINNTRRGHITDTNVWEDLSGNNIYADLYNCTINDNNIEFNGSSSYGLLPNGSLGEWGKPSTIEIVALSVNQSILIADNPNNSFRGIAVSPQSSNSQIVQNIIKGRDLSVLKNKFSTSTILYNKEILYTLVWDGISYSNTRAYINAYLAEKESDVGGYSNDLAQSVTIGRRFYR